MIDLWPKELAVVDQKSPLTILREQASLLGEKTQNVVTAVVEGEHVIPGSWQRDAPFRYGFTLTCPALGQYRFGAFAIAFGVEMYPVHFNLDTDIAPEVIEGSELELDGEGFPVASNEHEFIETLKLIFNSKKIVRVIRALLSQAGS
jgi:hypothetical protein